MRAWLRRLIGPDREYILCDHDQPASAFTAYAGSDRTGMTYFGHGTSLRKRPDGRLDIHFTKDPYTGTVDRVDLFFAERYIARVRVFPPVTGVDSICTLSVGLDLEPA